MNKDRRKKIRPVADDLLERALLILNQAKDEEEEALFNLPENLEDSEKYKLMENAIEYLEDAIECIEEAQENIRAAIE